MKRYYILLVLVCSWLGALAQPFVDTLYQIRDTTVIYGQAVDFAGNVRSLEMDISYPTNDTPYDGGRPLMLLIHGGAFISGSKADANIVRMREDFAKRGYVTAAINYRLGMFQTSQDAHCNITFLIEWDCLNEADTLEWYRAYYRGVQDARGAIRYLLENNPVSPWRVDHSNVYVVGESAGAFIAMGVGYMDTPSERPFGTDSIANVLAPHSRYDAACVQHYQLDTNIASMRLTRPDLGDMQGSLNPSSLPYTIRGVGDIFGATFKNLFRQRDTSQVIPALYAFHQPADLIVPIGHTRVLAGYANCAVGLGCIYILNRPFGMGGRAIRDSIQAMQSAGLAVPDLLAELTTNNAGCEQAFNNANVGHQFDNYWLRTNNMAVFFAPKIVGTAQAEVLRSKIYPNPAHDSFRVEAERPLERLEIMDFMGRIVWEVELHGSKSCLVELPAQLSKGMYLVRLNAANASSVQRLLIK